MAHLRYIENFEAGFTRKRIGDRWRYIDPNGRAVRAKSVVSRLESIALPPAYENAWYCPYPNGHIQAIGIDTKGRRQYRYHPDFSARKDADKYARILGFAGRLPVIRKQIELDVCKRDLSLERVVAGVIRLLDVGKVRVGNSKYARDNKSFGATTLNNRHVQLKGSRVILEYVGKSGKEQRISINDRRLSTVIKQCHDLPGQTLFQYVDSEGNRRPVTSGHVNDYLKTNAGEFSAKDFRTWGASVIAYSALVRERGQITLKQMLEEVAAELGNTPAIARKSYVHPAIIEAAQSRMTDGATWKLPRSSKYMSAEERGLVNFLQRS